MEAHPSCLKTSEISIQSKVHSLRVGAWASAVKQAYTRWMRARKVHNCSVRIHSSDRVNETHFLVQIQANVRIKPTRLNPKVTLKGPNG